jgi:antagonist of KipI
VTGLVFRVAAAGVLTTIQDLGRPRHRFAGVPPGGAMDRFAASAANLLVGNDAGAPILEATVTGPRLVAEQPAVVAVTGGDFAVEVNGAAAPAWTSFEVAAGDVVDLSRRRSGARCYVAVAGGGFRAARWLGSAATYLLVARGGLEGRALRADDLLEIVGGGSGAGPGRFRGAGATLAPAERPQYGSELAAVPGPHLKHLLPESRRRLFEAMFHVKHSSDRMGYRLSGGAPLAVRPVDLLSFGVAPGVVQVPGSGEPILLMADHQTAGGYPVVATVVRSSLPAAAQLLPGHELRFRRVTVEAAIAEWRRLRRALESLRSS